MSEPSSSHEPSIVCRSMVGRDDELARLQLALTEAGAGSGSFVVVRGAAGMGKSRVVRELATRSTTSGGRVLVGRCAAASGDSPLRPIREALLGLARSGHRPSGSAVEPFLPALARLVPDWADSTPAELSSVVVAEGVLRVLDAVAHEGAPALLVIDDVHWADADTTAVVDYLADHVSESRIMVVATLRDGEGGVGTEVCDRIVARRAGTVVQLMPLGADRVGDMVRLCLGTEQVDDEIVRLISARSDGVPFLVEELLAAAVSTRTLRSAAGTWQMADGVDRVVPASVRSSVAVRLASLPDPLVRLLRVGAILGRSFDWRLAARAAGVTTPEAPDLLRRAVGEHVLEVDGASYRFRHDLTRDAVEGEILPGERVALAGAALDALVRSDALGDEASADSIELAARLAVAADEPTRAADLFVQAAHAALRSGSLASAEVFAERAIAADHLPSPERADAIDRLLLEVWSLAGRVDDVLSVGGRILQSLARRSATASEAVSVRLVIARAALSAGRFDVATSQIEACRAVATSADLETIARLGVLEAQVAMGQDDATGALPLAQAALAAARDVGIAELECEAYEVIGRAERVRDLKAAGDAFEQAYRIADRAGLNLWKMWAMHELGTIDLFQSLASDRLEQARSQATSAGALSTLAVIDLQLVALYDERADVERALAAARSCVELSSRLELITIAMAHALAATAYARAGREAEMEQAIALSLETGLDRLNVELAMWGNSWATLYIGRGELERAAAAMDRCMDVLRRKPGGAYPFSGLWPLLHTVLNDDMQQAAREETRELAADTPTSRAQVVAADAVVLGRQGDLAGALAAFTAADEALSRFEGRYRQDMVRVLVAPCALADGWADPVVWLRESLARLERKQLVDLAETCRGIMRDAGASVPQRTTRQAAVPVDLAALGITARELEVLTLVVDGASNRAIAERLYLSPRTVEKHVERLLMKAGTTRQGLTSLAERAGLGRT